MDRANENQNFSLTPRQPSAVEKAELGTKRVLSDMVADTLALVKNMDQKVTVTTFRSVADGELEKWFQTGKKYANEQGVTHDYAEAVKWYRMAAEQNYAKAQFCLGWCYREGRGVAKDEMEAVKWWHKAAEQNNADAQFILGHCYAKGQCVAKDYVEAVKWFRKAAEPGRADYLIRGHTFAQLSLGRCYEHGQGVPQDVIEAYKFYKLFADDEVCHDPSDSLKRIVTRMSAVEIAEGERRYREFRLQKI